MPSTPVEYIVDYLCGGAFGGGDGGPEGVVEPFCGAASGAGGVDGVGCVHGGWDGLRASGSVVLGEEGAIVAYRWERGVGSLVIGYGSRHVLHMSVDIVGHGRVRLGRVVCRSSGWWLDRDALVGRAIVVLAWSGSSPRSRHWTRATGWG